MSENLSFEEMFKEARLRPRHWELVARRSIVIEFRKLLLQQNLSHEQFVEMFNCQFPQARMSMEWLDDFMSSKVDPPLSRVTNILFVLRHHLDCSVSSNIE